MKTPMRAHSPPINWTFNNDEAGHGGGGADDGLYEADDGDHYDEDDILRCPEIDKEVLLHTRWSQV